MRESIFAMLLLLSLLGQSCSPAAAPVGGKDREEVNVPNAATEDATINAEIYKMLSELDPEGDGLTKYSYEQLALIFDNRYRGTLFEISGTIHDIRRNAVSLTIVFRDKTWWVELKMTRPMSDSQFLSIKIGEKSKFRGRLLTNPYDVPDLRYNLKGKLINLVDGELLSPDQ